MPGCSECSAHVHGALYLGNSKNSNDKHVHAALPIYLTKIGLYQHTSSNLVTQSNHSPKHKIHCTNDGNSIREHVLN